MTRFHVWFALTCVACSSGSGGGGFTDGGLGGTGASGGSGAVGGGGSGGGGATGGTGTGGSSCSVVEGGLDLGTFRLALSINQAPEKPILYSTHLTSLVGPGGATVLSLSATPLDSKDRVTPVGPPVNITTDGLTTNVFHIPPTTVSVPAAANSVAGVDIEANVELLGEFCGVTDFYCGSLDGQVTVPITVDLTGSTFVLEAITTPEIHIDCNKTVAAPLEPQ